MPKYASARLIPIGHTSGYECGMKMQRNSDTLALESSPIKSTYIININTKKKYHKNRSCDICINGKLAKEAHNDYILDEK